MPIDFTLSDSQRELQQGARAFAEEVLRPVAMTIDRAPDAGWQVAHTLGTLEDLHAADVVWVISSVRGPIDVVELDGRTRERRPEIDAEIRRFCGF